MEGPTPKKLRSSPNPLTPVQNVSNFTARNIGPLKNSSLWYCNTCEGTLPAGNRNAILHIRGKNHKACRSKMEDLTTERIYCELCQTDVVKYFINQHNRILHQMEEEEIENSGASPTVSKTTKTQERKRREEDENIPNANSKKLQLILDAVTFTADDRVKKEKEFLQSIHTFILMMSSEFDQDIQVNNVSKSSLSIFASENVTLLHDGHPYCNICQVVLTVAGNNAVQQHIRGKKHRKEKMKEMDLKTYCEICKTDVVQGSINQHNEILHRIVKEVHVEQNANMTVSNITESQATRKRRKGDESQTTFQNSTFAEPASKKVRLILDAVTFTANNRMIKEREFLQRYHNFEQRKKIFVRRCNFCNLLSETEILREIHELCYHPIESAALKELISLQK